MQTGSLVYLTNFNVPSLQTGSQQGQKRKKKTGEQSLNLQAKQVRVQERSEWECR